MDYGAVLPPSLMVFLKFRFFLNLEVKPRSCDCPFELMTVGYIYHWIVGLIFVIQQLRPPNPIGCPLTIFAREPNHTQFKINLNKPQLTVKLHQTIINT